MNDLPLIFLPGTLCDASLFAPQMKALADVAIPQAVDVHLQDSITEVGQYVLGEVDGAFAVAGLSYGGIIAFELWRQAPERIAKIALLNTNPYEASPETRASQQRFIGMAHLGEFREVTTDFLKDVMLHPDHRKDLALRETVLNMAKHIGITGFVNEVKAQLARPSSVPDLETITCPTLIMTGKQDTVVPLAVHQMMAERIPHAHLVAIEHCGHLSTLDQPTIVNAALHDWLTGKGIWKEETA
ncbi:MAG: alpha/beta hydrolase [Chloroflexota bacterium]